jgi:hypothetical protein
MDCYRILGAASDTASTENKLAESCAQSTSSNICPAARSISWTARRRLMRLDDCAGRLPRFTPVDGAQRMRRTDVAAAWR